MAIIINDTSPRAQYTATAGQTIFVVPFEFFEAADLQVYKNTTLLTRPAQYTASGAGVTGGGSITLTSGAAVGDVITIIRDIPVSRTSDFPTSGPFNIDALNTDLDRLTAMIQERESSINRVLRLPETDAPSSTALPVKADRAGRVLAFNESTGVPQAGPLISTVQTVANAAGDIDTVAGSIASVNTVAGSISNVATTATNIASVNTAATNIASINTVASDLNEPVSEIETVAANITPVNTVGANISAVSTVAGQISPTNNVGTVATNIANVNTVAGVSGNVTTVAGISSNVTAVAGNAANINTVAGQITPTNRVQTVANIAADITSVAGIAANVTSVAGNATNINAVAGNAANVNTVAAANANINTVAGINGNVTTVAGIAANVSTVAGISSAVSTVASNTTPVSTVATNIAAVNTAATNITAIQNAASDAAAAAASAAAAAASYDSFDDRYLGPKASDPTLDNDGNALLQGALYFNTTTNSMKVYEGSSWLNAYASLSGALIAANNLTDLTDKPAARTNLGLGSAATQASSAFAAASHTHPASEISDSTAAGRSLLTAADAAAQRSALGLGTAALSATSDFAAASHTHAIANITNLQTSLDAKLNLSGGTLTGQLVSGAIASTMANGNTSSSLEIRNNSGTGDANMAMIGFHCQGSYGIKLGLRADGYIGIGGWSAATWQWYLAPGGHMVAAGNVTAYSDERLKRNWVDLADDLVDQIATIKAGSFERIDIGGRQLGVSAQSLQPIMPETVTEGVEGYLGVNYGNAALVASVALARRVMTLEARINALEEKLA